MNIRFELQKLCRKHTNCLLKECPYECKLYECAYWWNFPLLDRIKFFILGQFKQ